MNLYQVDIKIYDVMELYELPITIPLHMITAGRPRLGYHQLTLSEDELDALETWALTRSELKILGTHKIDQHETVR